MPEVAEAPVEVKKENPPIQETPVLDRLAEKSDLKIQATTKVQEERKAATPSTETVDTLKKATEIVADDKNKGSEALTEEQKAQAQLEENNKKISAEKEVKKTEGLEKKIETLETKVEENEIQKNHWEAEEEPLKEGETKATTDDKGNKIDNKEILLKKYESQAKEYEKLMSEPLVKAFISAKEAGKDVSTFINEVKGTDIKTLTDEQVWEKELQSASLTPDEVTAEMDSFKDLSPYQKKKQAEPIREKLESQQSERLKQYASENSATASQAKEVAIKFNTEKEQYLNSVKGKTVMGLEMTPARLQEQSDYIDNFSLQRADGTVDVSRIMRIGILEKNYKLLLQNAYTKGENDKAIKMLKEIARPSREDSALKLLPDTKSGAQKDVETFRKELRQN